MVVACLLLAYAWFEVPSPSIGQTISIFFKERSRKVPMPLSVRISRGDVIGTRAGHIRHTYVIVKVPKKLKWIGGL